MSTQDRDRPRRRGRPPNADTQVRVLAAARALMAQGGVAAVTMEALSARAHVTRPTIYRHWPNAQAVAMAALIDSAARRPQEGSPTSLIAELETELRAVIEAFSSPSGRSALALVASADPSTELAKAFRHQLLLKTRERVRDHLTAAAASGDAAATFDPDFMADAMLAPIFFRLLVGHAAVDGALVRQCLSLVAARLPDGRAGAGADGRSGA